MKNTGTLQVTTPTEREIVMTRVFDAPRRLVFDAFTKPELLKRWFGPRGWSMPVCEIDLKVGGAYRFLWRGPDAGWKPIAQLAPDVPPTRDLGRNLGAWLLGCAMVYATLFGIGKLCFG